MKLFAKKQRGQSITEVIVVVCLIAVAGILVTTIYGDNIRQQFGKIGQAVGGKNTDVVGETEFDYAAVEHRNLEDFSDGLDAFDDSMEEDEDIEYADVWNHNFDISWDPSTFSSGKITMVMKGSNKENPVYVNGHEVGMTQASNPDNGYFTATVQIDPSFLNQGSNNINVKSPKGSGVSVTSWWIGDFN